MKRLHSHHAWGGALLLLGWFLPVHSKSVPVVSLNPTEQTSNEYSIECFDCNPLIFGQPLNINIAPVEQLVALPSIGPSKAAAIVSWRQQEGAFASVEDLKRVRGIGPKTVLKLSAYVTVD